MEMRVGFRFRSPSPEATHAVARALSSVLEDGGLVIALEGPLGAGKTGFVKGVAEGLGLDPGVVSSPSFVIANEYAVPGRSARLVHVDLYRLEGVRELESTGFLDLLDIRNVIAIEWADRIPSAVPPEHLEVRITRPADGEGESVRIISASAFGLLAESVLRRWALCLGVSGTVELESPACP